MIARRGWAAAALALLVALAPVPALARPGGGHSFHGSSHHSSSHSSSSSHHSSSSSHHSSSHSSSRSYGHGSGTGSSSGAPLLEDWSAAETGTRVVVLFVVGGMLLVMLLIGFAVFALVGRRHGHWDSAMDPGPPGRTEDLEALRETDPDFSSVLFQDFAYALYARAHEARADAKRLAALGPYLADAAREHLASREPAGVPVRAAVVGAVRVESVTRAAARAVVALRYEANLVLAGAGGGRTQYVKEHWLLARPGDARTRPWKGVRTFGCPACGHPLTEDASGRCGHCGERVDDGRFDWKVETIALEELENRPPTLTGTVEEEGTDRPTVYQDGCAERLAELLRDDPALSLENLAGRLGRIFEALQAAWAAQDLKGVRPFVSASLHNYLAYWIGAYREQGLANRVDGARLLQSELVRVLRDAHYDAVTLRLRATGCDYTLRVDTGEVVGGSRTKERPYTEYWTLVRGAAVRGAPRADDRCPACGGPLRVSMEGSCEYCGALVASGDFDWVLSRIEQDEVYTG